MQGGVGQKSRGVGSMESASQRCRSSQWEFSSRSGYAIWGRGQGRKLWWEAGPARKKSCHNKGRKPACRRRSGGTARGAPDRLSQSSVTEDQARRCRGRESDAAEHQGVAQHRVLEGPSKRSLWVTANRHCEPPGVV